jgi:acyl-coenzyme A thioesterase PaaI-like protein
MTALQRLARLFGPHRFLRVIGLWPPYLGAGIRVTRADADLRVIEVALTLRAWNRNYVGTQFGGSLYSMCDPFYMLMVMENLGREYIVWDKSATIEFKRPGRGRVRARFELGEDVLASIREEVARAGRSHPRFTVHVVDDAGTEVARIYKVLSVRRRPASASPSEPTAVLR